MWRSCTLAKQIELVFGVSVTTDGRYFALDRGSGSTHRKENLTGRWSVKLLKFSPGGYLFTVLNSDLHLVMIAEFLLQQTSHSNRYILRMIPKTTRMFRPVRQVAAPGRSLQSLTVWHRPNAFADTVGWRRHENPLCRYIKPGPHQQQSRSNIVECYNVECCFDIVASVDRALDWQPYWCRSSSCCCCCQIKGGERRKRDARDEK